MDRLDNYVYDVFHLLQYEFQSDITGVHVNEEYAIVSKGRTTERQPHVGELHLQILPHLCVFGRRNTDVLVRRKFDNM